MLSYILLITSLSYSNGLIHYPQDKSTTQNLTDCVTKLIREWRVDNFNKSHLDLTLVNMNNDLDLSTLYQLKNIENISRTFSWKPNGFPHFAFLIIIEELEELMQGLNKISRDYFWNPSARFIIVIKSFQDSNILINLHELFRDYNINDVTIILKQKSDFAVYMYNSSLSSCLDYRRLEFVSSCSDYTVRRKLPSLSEINDIRGCYFSFVANDLWPYVSPAGANIKGVDQHLLKIFEDYKEVKIKLTLRSMLNIYGEVNAGFLPSLLKSVETNEFEGAIGGLNIRYEFLGNLSFTYPSFIDRQVLVFPKEYSQVWERVFTDSFYTHLLAGASFIIFCALAVFLSVFPTQRKDAVGNILLVLGYILNKANTKNTGSGLPQRLLLGSLFLFALFLPYTIQSLLYSVNPVHGYLMKQPSDLNKYNLILYGAFPNSNLSSHNKNCGTIINCLTQVKNSEDKSLYTIVSETLFKAYSWKLADEYCESSLYRHKIPLFLTMRTIYLRRGSVLLEHMSKYVSNMVASGLLLKYGSDLESRDKFKCRPKYKPDHVPLKFDDVYGAFLVIIFGSSISTIVFICELVISKKVIKNRRLNGQK